MTTLIVLFRLKDPGQRQAYETWARETDLPVVRSLSSVDGFRLCRVEGLLGSDASAPYDYVELIEIADREHFGAEIATDTMTRVAAEFRRFADAPVFMLTGDVQQGDAR